MLKPCKPCLCTRVTCEQCMFGYNDDSTNHRLMKDLIEQILAGEQPPGYLLAARYMNWHGNWKKEMEEG